MAAGVTDIVAARFAFLLFVPVSGLSRAASSKFWSSEGIQMTALGALAQVFPKREQGEAGFGDQEVTLATRKGCPSTVSPHKPAPVRMAGKKVFSPLDCFRFFFTFPPGERVFRRERRE